MKKQEKTIAGMGVILLSLFLNACSTGYGSSYPERRAIPTIPEISRPVVRRAPAKVIPRKPVKKVYAASVPLVKKYSSSKSSTPVITQKEVATVLSKEERVKLAQKNATVEFDPYAVIPDNRSAKVTSSKTTSAKTTSTKKPPVSTAKTSPAVTSLMLQAKGELAIGNTQSAVSKIERALRIESRNPKLWSLLAKANYDQGSYQQAISMAKKSIRYSRNDDVIAKNWELVKKSGEKSGDAEVVKEALNYFKLNP